MTRCGRLRIEDLHWLTAASLVELALEKTCQLLIVNDLVVVIDDLFCCLLQLLWRLLWRLLRWLLWRLLAAAAAAR
jgi:hypothetical protein